MITANWNIKCYVDCPYCNYYTNLLSEVNDSHEFLPAPGHSEEIEVEIKCPKCDRTYTIQNVEW